MTGAGRSSLALDALPAEIRESNRLVLWNYETRNRKPTKVQYVPRDRAIQSDGTTLVGCRCVTLRRGVKCDARTTRRHTKRRPRATKVGAVLRALWPGFRDA